MKCEVYLSAKKAERRGNEKCLLLTITSLTQNDAYLSDLTLYQFDMVEGEERYVQRGVSSVPILRVHPNPLNRMAEIRYGVAEKGPVSLRIYDVTGRLIKTLAKAQSQEPGVYRVTWDRTDDKGRKLSNGIYFLRLNNKNHPLTYKVIMVK